MGQFTYTGGHDLTHRFNIDGLGKLYIIVTAVWTTVLAGGITFLLSNQHLAILRVRKVWLSVIAISTLHVYWCLAMLAYVLNGYFPCQLEFWIMSTFLPWGIAFYQVVNTRLLYYATLQKKIVTSSGVQSERKEVAGRRGLLKLWTKWKLYDVMTRTLIGLGCGLAVQTIVTVVLFLGSRRMHPSFGAFGHEVDSGTCRKGFEWWPSFAWQLIWSWIYAPYLLWKIRGVDDNHGWRLQTMVCSLAGLPATPLWIAGLYSESFSTINKYWVPPLWYSPGIIVMEASLIFIPCWQVLKSRHLRKETLEILEQWEEKKNAGARDDQSTLATNSVLSSKTRTTKSSGTSSRSSARGEMYSRQALEKALSTNSAPLLIFAAFKEFSGENISFLNHIRQWKACWDPTPYNRFSTFTPKNDRRLEGEALRRHQFSLAVEIYLSFISTQHSDFPLNLSSTHLRELNKVFSSAAAATDTTTIVPCRPFETRGSRPFDVEHGSEKELVSVTVVPIHSDADSMVDTGTTTTFGAAQPTVDKLNLLDLQPRLPPSVPIPDSFGPDVFDHAEESIKYMVLTNTWPRFVDTGYANTVESERSTFMVWLQNLFGAPRRIRFSR